MIKQNQILQQTQKLTPQQVQLIRMLELPVVELEERIKKELEENPTLEEGKEVESSDTDFNDDFEENNNSDSADFDIEFGNYRSEDDIPDYRLQESARQKEYREPETTYSGSSSFTEYLKDQLSLKEVGDSVLKAAEYIIGNLDNNGYLSRELYAIGDDIAFAEGAEFNSEIIEDALSVVQELDPAGVAARNLQECLILQLERKKANPITQLAYSIIKDDFDAFAKRHFEKIQKTYSITQDELKDVTQEILSLNPKPGAAWSDLIERSEERRVGKEC